jgi:hypothetical protein
VCPKKPWVQPDAANPLGNEARVVAKELLVRHPNFSVGRWARGLPYRRQEDLDTLVNPLKMAGLPE